MNPNEQERYDIAEMVRKLNPTNLIGTYDHWNSKREKLNHNAMRASMNQLQINKLTFGINLMREKILKKIS